MIDQRCSGSALVAVLILLCLLSAASLAVFFYTHHALKLLNSETGAGRSIAAAKDELILRFAEHIPDPKETLFCLNTEAYPALKLCGRTYFEDQALQSTLKVEPLAFIYK